MLTNLKVFTACKSLFSYSAGNGFKNKSVTVNASCYRNET